MIQIYNPDNTDYEKNGDMTIFPTSAVVHPILNGSWSAELEHPIDDEGRWKYLQEEAVVKMPSFNGSQLFRIRHTEKADSGIICEMEPIFFDSIGDCFLEDIRPTGKNGQEALDLMTAPNGKYSGKSNITRAATAYYQFKNLMQAVKGEDDNSFISRWGGEILFDNFKIIINDRVGGDYGVELRYGKNITQDGLTEEIDTRSIVTRIYPKAYNGYTMTNNGYVDSPLINCYPTVKSATITFSDVKMEADEQEDDAENGVIICKNQAELDAALRKRCQEQYTAGLDKPTVTITADMVLLQDTELYKGYQVLETVSLGDTIHCRHSRLGIVTDVRVIELEYDSVLQKVSSVVLGDFQYNYFSNVSSAVNRINQAIRPDGTLIAEKVAGFINGAMSSLRAQYNIAKKQDILAILFENLEEGNPLYGALAIGTQGILISKKRTADGRGWEWTTALTAGGLIANNVIVGILSDKLGKNYWNLDTGDFRLASASTLVDGKPLDAVFSNNLLLDYIGLSTEYWDYPYTKVEYGQQDPLGGTGAVKLTGMTVTFAGIPWEWEPDMRSKENNKPIKIGNKTYTVSIWLKANVETTGSVKLYTEKKDIGITTSWQRYNFTMQVGKYEDTAQYQFEVKGDRYKEDGTPVEIYVYNPEVIYQDAEIPDLTQEDIYNLVTHNGQYQVLQMLDGKIFLNGEWINANTITSTAMRDGTVTRTKIQGGAVSTDELDSKAVTAEKIGVSELAAIGATIGGFKINDMQIYTDPDSNDVTSLVLCSWSNGVYILMRHKENGSYVTDYYWDKEGFVSDDRSSLQLLRHTTLNSDEFMDGTHHNLGSTQFNGPVDVHDDFKVASGCTKSVERDTEDYGTQDFYCYETPTPSLGDFGAGIIAEDGSCVVDIDDIFRESVNTEIEYYVFLQKEGKGDLWVSEKADTYFVVRGTPGLKFTYEVKAKQLGLEHIRFKDASRNRDVGFREVDYVAVLNGDKEKIEGEIDYEAVLETEREKLIKEMEEIKE